VTAPAFPKIDSPRISPARFTHGGIQTIPGFRNTDQVDMVRHETISPYFDMVLCTPIRHEFQIGKMVFIIEKSLLPPVSPLNHMVGQARCNSSCYSRHAFFRTNRFPVVNRSVWCPPNIPDDFRSYGGANFALVDTDSEIQHKYGSVIAMDNKSLYHAHEDGFPEGQIINPDEINIIYRHSSATDTVVAVGTILRKK
jgi:hypothetical protein